MISEAYKLIEYCRSLSSQTNDLMPALSSFTAALADELELLNKHKTGHNVEMSAILEAHQKTIELHILSVKELDRIGIEDKWFSQWLSEKEKGWVVG